MDVARDFGTMLGEHTLKAGLIDLNPNLQFDVAGRIDAMWAMNMKRQSVYCGDRHICSMDRGDSIPEYNVWALVTLPDGSKQKTHIIKVGWRHTFERLVKRHIPGITWDALSSKFGVERKMPNPFNPPLLEID